MLPVVAAAVVVAVDLRRRPAAACIAYGVTMLALYGWSIGQTPAFRPMAPAPVETALALAFTVIAALIGSVAGRWIADVLQPAADHTSAPARPVAREGTVSRRA